MSSAMLGAQAMEQEAEGRAKIDGGKISMSSELKNSNPSVGELRPRIAKGKPGFIAL